MTTGRNNCISALLVAGASVTASMLVVQMAVLPLLFKYSKAVQRKMVFCNCINYPRNLDYEDPASVNVIGGRHLTINFQSTVDKCPIKIGIWHIVPTTLFQDVFFIKDYGTLDAKLRDELRKTKQPVLLYCHGNSNHRASPHRLQMYKVFQDLKFHTITFDYRGYGDSTNVRPTESGVVEDTLQVYSWMMKSIRQENRPLVVLWGHSLGTAVAAHLVSKLTKLCKERGMSRLPQPDALVLEAPFNNLIEEIEKHPFSKIVSWLPYYKGTFVKPFTSSSEYSFATDEYLIHVPHIPILMLHAKGDKIVPYELAVKLYKSVSSSRGSVAAPLVLHSFERGSGLGHNNLCEATDLRSVVCDFLNLLKDGSAAVVNI